MKTQRLSGKTAVITGSTGGIGRAIALRLAQAGAHVVVTARAADRAGATVDAIHKAGGTARALALDVTADANELRAFAATATDALGGHVDILVNNAGVYPGGPSETLSDEDVQALLNANIRAPHTLVSALAPGMIERGAGTIINISSFTARYGAANGALYPATKSALEQLTRGWAAEYGHRGVRVNAVSPGVVPSQGNAAVRELIDSIGKTTPAGQAVPDTAIADAVLFLCSEESAFIHGAILDVDGGIGAVRPS